MWTSRRSIAHVVPLVGLELALTILFGGPVLPAASAAAVERFTSHDDWRAQYPWDRQDYRWRPQDP